MTQCWPIFNAAVSQDFIKLVIFLKNYLEERSFLKITIMSDRTYEFKKNKSWKWISKCNSES